MTTRFWEAIDNMKRLMDELHNGKECKWCEYREAPPKGVYVLYENGDPIHVGRSNAMSRRIREHGAESSDRHSATFAFKLLRESLNHPKGSAVQIEKAYSEEYRQQRHRVRAMTFRAVAVPDQLEQTLFEIYAVLEMGTAPRYNDFETH